MVGRLCAAGLTKYCWSALCHHQSRPPHLTHNSRAPKTVAPFFLPTSRWLKANSSAHDIVQAFHKPLMVFPGLGVRVRTFNREPAKKSLPKFNPSPEINHNFFSTFAPVPTAVTPRPWTQGIAPHLQSQTFFPTSFPPRFPSTESPLRLPRPSRKTDRPSLRPSSRPRSEEPRSISPAVSGQRGSGKVPIFTHLPKHQVGNSFGKFMASSYFEYSKSMTGKVLACPSNVTQPCYIME